MRQPPIFGYGEGDGATVDVEAETSNGALGAGAPGGAALPAPHADRTETQTTAHNTFIHEPYPRALRIKRGSAGCQLCHETGEHFVAIACGFQRFFRYA